MSARSVESAGDWQDDEAIDHVLRAAAESDARVLNVSGRYRLTRDVRLQPGMTITGGGTLDFHGASLIVESHCRIENLALTDRTGQGWRPLVVVDYHRQDVAIRDCSIDGGVAIWLNKNRDIRIERCAIASNGGYPIFSDGLEYGVILDNVITAHGGYGVELSGSVTYCRIARNIVAGDGKTKTGIIFINKTPGLIAHNVIEENVIDAVSEEGISIDINCRPIIGRVTTERSAGAAKIVCDFDFSFRNDAAKLTPGQTLILATGPQAGRYAAISGPYSELDRSLTISDATFGAVAVGVEFWVAWAPYDNCIRANTVVRAGRNGVMLYGMQTGNRVLANRVCDCGFGDPPIWEGRQAYFLGGIAALTISQRDHVSPLSGCEISGNTVCKCPVGLHVGVALWDGPTERTPIGMIVNGNVFRDCDRNVVTN